MGEPYYADTACDSSDFQPQIKLLPPDLGDEFRCQDRRESWEGICGLRRWLELKIRSALKSFVVSNKPPRVIQQCCWSARRWRSCT